ncbi:MAG: OPT/YSL family transporter [Eubacteriales bacterium]|nr:OPT/YSL family transporter [Eubacteriales bacterium]
MELDQSKVKHASSFKEQFTARAVIIGIVGSVILTCSSMFVALKASSLPWPIMFVALVSMFCLKGLGNTNVNEINVAHTAMSAGSMVAGGLAFTIPGIFILNNDASLNMPQVMLVTVGGTILGLIFTSLLRKHFVVTADMPYAMGQAAAEVVVVGDEGGKKTGALFGSLGIAGVWTWLRDWAGVIPACSWFNGMMNYGSLGGIWWSPMLMAVGYLIGPMTIGVWFLGALIGDFGILIGGQASGLLTAEAAAGVKSSLGLGWMVGVGLAITAKEIIPRAKQIFGGMFAKDQVGDAIVPMRWAPFVILALAVLFIFVLDMPVVAVIITLLGVWLTTAMSSQCVGQSAINPMEVFGIFVMAIAKVVCSLEVTQAVFVAAIVAIAAGLTGDVMNDFKSGSILHTDPKAQWYGELIGGVIGAVVAVFVMFILVAAYGGGVFGSEMFPAAQAAAVASVVGGIANVPVFIGGLAASIIIYFITPKFTMLGLGIYLPFYLSATAFIGGMIKLIVEKAAPAFAKGSTGTVVASGLLAGEGFIGVVIAMIQAIQILMAV